MKTGLRPKPSGGRGQPADDWTLPHNSPAELIAFVRLSTDSVWLFTLDEARGLAQQHHPNGNRHIYWYINEAVISQRRATSITESDVERYRFDNRVEELFLKTPIYPFKNGLPVGVDCVRVGPSYPVYWADGRVETWDRHYHVTDGTWIKAAATAETTYNGQGFGLPTC